MARLLQVFSKRGAVQPLNFLTNNVARVFSTAVQPVVGEPNEAFTKWTNPYPQTFSYTQDLAEPATKITTLSNGLRVATEVVPYATTATVGVWIDAGSRFETDKNNGTAHFLEHLVFKGTSARNQGQLEVEIENLGAFLNAYTSREQTTYYAKVMKQDVPKVVEILSDMLQNSGLVSEKIENERQTILKEMNEVMDVPEEVLFDHLHATAFQHTPLSRTILGPAENVKAITKADIDGYIKTHYTAPRMVLVGTGAVDHDELVALAEKSFNKLPSEPSTAKEIAAKNPSHFTGSEIRFRDDDLGMCHLAIAFEGASWTDPDSITLMVMQTMLGAWSKDHPAGFDVASKLGQRLAADELCESYSAFNTNYSDTGLFGIQAVAPGGERLEDLVWSIMYEVSGLIYSVDEDDVTRAKNELKSSLALHSEGTGPKAEEVGRQILTYGRRMPKAELFARIDAVTGEHVKAAADKFIHDKDIAVIAMGPTQFIPDYNWIRRRTFRNRF